MGFTNLFFDSGLVGEFELVFSKSLYDLDYLRTAIRNRNFRNSATGHYGDAEDISFSDKVEVLIACVEDQFRSGDTVALFSLAMSLLAVTVTALHEVAAGLLISELIILAGIVLLLFVCSRSFAYQKRTKLLQALRILRSESYGAEQNMSDFVVEDGVWHRGFYCDDDDGKYRGLEEYPYIIDYPEIDEDVAGLTASGYLRGSCNIFALALESEFQYPAFIIENASDGKSFHAFCQVCKNGIFYFVDARGVTTSFDEFLLVAREFADREFIVRRVDDDDRKNWAQDDDFNLVFQSMISFIRDKRSYYSVR